MKKKTQIRKGSIVTGECYRGWPLSYRVTGLKPLQLVERIESALAELGAQAKAGDDVASRGFEGLLSDIGKEHLNMIRERAKDGGKTFNRQHPIESLLWVADDTTSFLGWLAKNKSADCAFWAERRTDWPGFISTLADVESKSQAIKDYIPLGKKFQHYNRRRTRVDILFRCARSAIQYFTGFSRDSLEVFYFYPDIKGIEWFKSKKAEKAINDYCAAVLGPVTRANWKAWKPIFARFITLRYGPPAERWKLIPDTQNPSYQNSIRKSSNPELVPESWKANLDIAVQFGVMAEWYEEFGNKLRPSLGSKSECQKDFERWAKRDPQTFIMEMKPDDALGCLQARAKRRNGKWGDYKNEILRRCKNLLPPQ